MPSDRVNSSDLSHLLPGLRVLALRQLGNAATAEDVAQEAIVRALGAIANGQLREPHKVAAFVAGIARHIITDHIRAKRHVEVDVFAIELPSAHPDALAELISSEERAQLRHMLARLSTADQELLRLTYEEGLSAAEVAERLQETPVVVRKRKSRALERLRANFGHKSPAAATSKKRDAPHFPGAKAIVADV